MGARAVRIFLVHAEQDHRLFDLLTSQARGAGIPVEFSHMPSKQPWVPHWKKSCRERIFACDGAIVLISRKTSGASGVGAELDFLSEAQVPTLGVLADQDAGTVPAQIRDVPLAAWSWTAIGEFLRSIERGAAAGGA